MKEIRRIAEKDVPLVGSNAEQLKRWVRGDNVHARAGGSWECCPDFSCCYPDCAVSIAVRKKFVEAGTDGRMKFLAQFLSSFIEKVSGSSRKVHVVGSVPQRGRR